MKANEIMIGDWMFVNDVEHLRPMQIGAIKKRSGSFYAELADPNDATEHCECILSKLVPIEINDWILERSGFKQGTGRFGESFNDWVWRDPRQDSVVIVTQKPLDLPRRIVIKSYLRDEDVITAIDAPIEYVHELQHLLGFCGVSLELKV